MTENVADTGSIDTDTSSEAVTDPVEAVAPAEGVTEDVIAEGGETETGEGQEADEVVSEVPESYVFGSEGDDLDTDMIEAITPVMKELGLTQEQANKLFDAYNSVGGVADGQVVTQALAKWEGDLKKDPDFGGENYAKNAAAVSQFIQATVPEEVKEDFIKVMRDTGIGSHPAMVKYIHSLSKQFPTGEDVPIGGRSTHNRPKTREERMYPNG